MGYKKHLGAWKQKLMITKVERDQNMQLGPRDLEI